MDTFTVDEAANTIWEHQHVNFSRITECLLSADKLDLTLSVSLCVVSSDIEVTIQAPESILIL